VPKLSDAFTVHGASYVRPPIQPIKVDLAFEKMDSFQWHGRETWCTVTAGNSPGHRSWLSRGLLAAHDVAFPRPANP